VPEDYFKLFNLFADADLDDVKKAYRKLAKENHPDRFSDEAVKKKQEKKMAAINAAYEAILKDFKDRPDKGNNAKERPEKESDTDIYKRGVAYFNKYSGSISLRFKDFAYDLESTLEKRKNIELARAIFRLLLQEYPDSDWSYDAEQRLERIDKNIHILDENIEFLKTHTLGHTKKGTPAWKKKE
jgi:curved DNA-binding protein CbpA